MQESKTRSLIGKVDEFLIIEKVENVLLFDSYILFCLKKSFSENRYQCFLNIFKKKTGGWSRNNPYEPPKQTVQSEINEDVTVYINCVAPFS